MPLPAAGTYPPHYDNYLKLLPPGAELVPLLQSQVGVLLGLPSTNAAAKAEYAYAPGKWTVKEIIGHVTDSERIFTYRIVSIARGEQQPLPGFDENAYVPVAYFNRRSLTSLVQEWASVRQSLILLAENLPPECLANTGTSNGKQVSLQALLYLVPGHLAHHLQVLQERYGVLLPPKV